MLTHNEKIKLFIGNDLKTFNPPEVWAEMGKRMQENNDLPSPKFLKDKAMSLNSISDTNHISETNEEHLTSPMNDESRHNTETLVVEEEYF